MRSAMLGIALVFVAALVFAQASRGRTTRQTVILEQPRGDSVVLVTVPAGTVVELLQQRNDWYRVSVVSSGKPVVGWIHRVSIEAIPGGDAERARPAPPPAPVPAPAAPRTPIRTVEARPAREVRATGTSPRGFIAVNGTYQINSNNYQDSGTFRANAEDGRITTDYRIQGGPAFDIGGGVALWRQLALGVGVSQYSRTTGAALTASIPHPFFFNQARSVDGTVGGLSRKELAVHIQARGMYALNPRLLVMAFGGPSYFQVTQGVATDVTYDEAYPYDSASFHSAVTTTAKRRKLGFNAGGDVSFFFTRQVGAGFTAQFARSTVDLPSVSGGTTQVKAGGIQAGGGLRVRF